MTKPYLTVIPLLLDGKMHKKSSTLIHVWGTSFQCLLKSWKRTKEWWAHCLAGTNLGVCCLEVIMFTPKCPHAEIACRAAGSCISVCCLCQRGIPIERNLSLKYKWRGQGEALDHFYQRNKSFPFKLISSCWLNMSCHWLWPIQSSSAINAFQWQAKTLWRRWRLMCIDVPWTSITGL